MKIRVIPTRILFKRAFWAMVMPRRIFSGVNEHERINYFLVIPLIASWWYFFGHLHLRCMNNVWVWKAWPPEMTRGVLVTFMMNSLMNWLLLVCLFWCVARIFKRRATLPQLEVAAFYLWFVWALMPFVDMLHLLNFPKYTFVLRVFKNRPTFFYAHAGWLLLPFMIGELFFICKNLIGFKKTSSVRDNLLNIGLALFLILFGRATLVSLGDFLISGILNLNWGWGYWNVAIGMSAIGLFVCSVFWVLLFMRQVHALRGIE